MAASGVRPAPHQGHVSTRSYGTVVVGSLTTFSTGDRMRRDRLVGKRRAARAGTLSLALSLALVAMGAPPPAGAADLGGTIPSGTSAVDNFNTDLFTGAATAQIPIEVPAGAAGVAPKIALLYNSATVDELKITEPGQSTGLGW